MCFCFFYKQKTAYEMRISDWSSDVCSSDLSYPIALEGALKLKEISYIHAEGYAAGEMKHGPIALIDDSVPVIVVAPTDEIFDKTASNVEEAIARGGKVLFLDRKSTRLNSSH